MPGSPLLRSIGSRHPARVAVRRMAYVALGLCGGSVVATSATAAPGHSSRLGGIEPQGPATRAVTALHHNPAMLAAIPGTAVHASIGLGVGQHRIARNAIDEQTGDPLPQLQPALWSRSSIVPYFAGASFYFDPIAVGIGIYDLGSRYQLRSDNPLRYHLAPDPDADCLAAGLSSCPPNGGSVRYRHDVTASLAYNGGPVKLGASLHLPMVSERFAFDYDTELRPSSTAATTPRCTDKEDPNCAERVGFKGWTQWIPQNGAPSGLDFSITVGAAVVLAHDRVVLGARYRTAALRRGGEVVLGGVGLVCRPDADASTDDPSVGVPPCSQPTPVRATVRQQLPQQLALGGSFVLGRSRLWRLDTNLYWLDECPGGIRATRCASGGAQSLRLAGLGADAVALPEFSRYRGFSDVYGADVYTRFRAKTNLFVIGAAHFASPGVRRGAMTPAFSDGWRLGTSLGARIRLPTLNMTLVPGYGLDVVLPRRVTPQGALFSPSSATTFESGTGDINAPGADAVLDGRGRSTNAGRYMGLMHTLTFTFLWGERTTID